MAKEDFRAKTMEMIRNIKTKDDWERFVNLFVQFYPERKKEFKTLSGIPINRLYTPDDIRDLDYNRDLCFPCVHPFTRGVYPTMHRGVYWTRRLIAGYGTPEDTNRRLKFLIKQGQTGLNVIFDLPTHRGIDPDDPRARGEVGKDGVSCPTLRDMEAIFEGISIEKYSVSVITAAHVFAMYIAMAEKRGLDLSRLRGTVQSDMLQAIQGCGALASDIYSRGPGAIDFAVEICVDIIEFCTKHMPKWYPISIVGRNIREAGADAVQEIAFAFSNGITFVEKCIARGMDVNQFGQRLSFMFSAENDFFEEIAKFRAARRVWANLMKERFGATNPLAMLMRVHVQNSSLAYTAQQPLNNIIRGTIHTIAAVLGGVQSIHTNAYDEAWGLPTEESAMVALRTQQIIAEESGIMDTIDPLAGSYYVEWLTNKLEEKIVELMKEIEKNGGMIKLTENGWVKRKLREGCYRFQKEIEKGERAVVGVNKYIVEGEQLNINILEVDPKAEGHQIARVRKVREERDERDAKKALDALREAADRKVKNPKENIIRPAIDAFKAGATLGEVYSAIWPPERFRR
jgi:methylmalonyl-CoA mutase N-terminal domain/subunit